MATANCKKSSSSFFVFSPSMNGKDLAPVESLKLLLSKIDLPRRALSKVVLLLEISEMYF